ncbi:MAG: cytochrome-c peroxidase [Planctomycetota bacterium]
MMFVVRPAPPLPVDGARRTPRAAAGALAALLGAALLIPPLASPISAQETTGGDGAALHFSDKELRRISRHSPLPPPPADPTNRVADDPRAVHLGRFLFFDPRLSGKGDVSCASCHEPARGFADGLARRWVDMRHTPSLWNVAHNRWFFWDGRADSLWAQALHSIEAPLEFGGSRLQVAHLVHDDPELRRAYEALFGPLPDLSDDDRFPPAGRPLPEDPEEALHRAWLSMAIEDRRTIDRIFAGIGKAIAAYERRLVSDRSPFDLFAEGLLDGDPEKRRALSPAARRGLKLFVGSANCRSCHAGPNLSDGEFHNIGVPPLGGNAPRDPGRYRGGELVLADPFNARGDHSDDRRGRAAMRLERLRISGRAWGEFKTPSLRNVARTAPYMHQGQFRSLREVVTFYSTLENVIPYGHHKETVLKPLNLSDDQIDDLVAFLESLTDEELEPALTRPPSSPLPPGLRE